MGCSNECDGGDGYSRGCDVGGWGVTEGKGI